jgi:hypothetical protein
MPKRASIAIYQRSVETANETQPIVPDEVFLAVQDVCKNKITKVVRCRTGVFVILYSDTGPFIEDVPHEEWLPVQVFCLKQWASGGVKTCEMQDFVETLKESESVKQA